MVWRNIRQNMIDYESLMMMIEIATPNWLQLVMFWRQTSVTSYSSSPPCVFQQEAETALPEQKKNQAAHPLLAEKHKPSKKTAHPWLSSKQTQTALTPSTFRQKHKPTQRKALIRLKYWCLSDWAKAGLSVISVVTINWFAGKTLISLE